MLEQSLGATYNGMGLQHVLGLRWTRGLGGSPRPLLADAHLSAGLSHTLTPSYTRVSTWAELAPLSILEVRAGVEPGLYFGAFGSAMSFTGYDSPFADRDRRSRKSEARSGTGARAYVAPTLKLALRTFAFSSTASLEWWRASAASPYFYEPSRDTLLKSSGDQLVNVSTVLVRRLPRPDGGRLTYGLSHELTAVSGAPGNRSQRIGVVLARQFASRHLGMPSPSLGARLAYYVSDPYREGQLSLAVGVSVERER